MAPIGEMYSLSKCFLFFLLLNGQFRLEAPTTLEIYVYIIYIYTIVV